MDKSRALPFQGIYPMLYAFWREDGRLDEAAMERQVEHAIAAGAHGIAIMGLVTEVHRMDAAQRLATIRLVGRLLAGRLPYSVTVPGEAADEQAAFAQACIEAGADWLVLQPPASRKLDEDELIAWFAGVSETIACPIGVQNNPEHLLNAFSAEGLMRLHAEVPKIVIVKGEGPVAAMEPMVAPTAATLSTFGGHGGLEHISLLRAGAAGLIPAPDCLPLQVRVHELWMRGDAGGRAEAEAIQREILPLIVFMNRSIDGLLCYGRRFMARRLGLDTTHDRFGKMAPTPFGMAEVARFLEALDASEARWLPARGA